MEKEGVSMTLNSERKTGSDCTIDELRHRLEVAESALRELRRTRCDNQTEDKREGEEEIHSGLESGDSVGDRGPSRSYGQDVELWQPAMQSRILASLMDALPIPMFATDKRGKICIFNRAFKAAIGDARADIPGELLPDGWQDDPGNDSADNSIDLLSFGNNPGYKRKFTDSNGIEREVVLYKSAYREAVDRDVGIVGVMLDITALRHEERQWAEIENKFFAAFHNSPYGISVTRLTDGKFLDVNEAFCSISGYSREEILASTSLDLNLWVNPEDRERVISDLLKNVMVYGRELWFRQKSGVALPGLFYASLITFEEDRCIVSSIMDLTEFKKTEVALVQSEKRFRLLFDSMLFGFCIGELVIENEKAVDFVFLDVNPSFEHIMGIRKEQALNQPASVLYGVQQAPLLDLICKVVRSGVPLHIETFFDSISRYLEVTINRLADGLFCLLFSDITDRKQAEEALSESERKFKLLADNTVDCIWLMDMNMTFQYINPAVEKMTGWTVEEWVGTNLRDHCDQENFEKMSTIVMNVQKNFSFDTGIAFEAIMLKKSKEPIHVEITGKALLDENGAIAGLQGVTRNISDRKFAELEKEKLRKQLVTAQRMESIGRLAGGVAHDYNNMLSVIIGFTELALDRKTMDDSLRKDLMEVLNAGRRSAEITRQLQAFARHQIIKPKLLDLNGVIEGMLKMLRRLINEDIELIWRPGYGIMQVYIDSSQIDQILANLIVNAQDAIGGAGRITIETHRVKIEKNSKTDKISIPGDYVLLVVSDNGCGMDRETLNKLFEPFFTTKGVGEGTGLGLSTVYGIVNQNSGFIAVTADPGIGTTFKIYLPLIEESDSEGMKAELREHVSAKGETVLIVEDEVSILKLTSHILKQQGYVVIEASKPEQAIRTMQEISDLHLLITDVVMPKMNGRELAEALLKEHPQLKVLFMSGYTADVIAHHGVLVEGVNFLPKPFSKRDLTGKVREVLDS
ncbi:PAS domain S-box protein [bacterium]|nr:PAS domain S-box protein [candidate division CSSED10-310 bacterium]